MQLHGLPEDTAFQLQKNAMSHRITIGEMARLLDAQNYSTIN